MGDTESRKTRSFAAKEPSSLAMKPEAVQSKP
jgi:hypothetical protein